MSEDKADYDTETKNALEMLGAGYEQPAAVIDPPRNLLSLSDKGLVEYKAWGWVKTSAKFKYHLQYLKGAKLAIWMCVALSIDETGSCQMPIKEICSLTKYSHTEVIESLKELEDGGYLSINKDKKTNIYSPLFVARGEEKPKETLVKKLDSTPPYQYESSPAIENSDSSIKELKRVKGDLVDLEISKLPAKSVRQAIHDYFKLNVNWENKYSRQWMEWAVEAKITPEQIEQAANIWRSSKTFNWQTPSLKGIFEKWQMLMEELPKSEQVGRGRMMEVLGDRE